MRARSIFRGILGTLMYPAILFGTAGTWRWIEGWVFIAILYSSTVVLLVWLKRHDPALLAERMKGLFQPGQPLWDRVILGLFSALWLAWISVPGLDAVRYHTSDVSVALKIVGGAANVLGWLGIFWVHRANTFLAPVVRIQTEREQRVIDHGPYALVRHPMYAAFILWLPGAGLLLGSWWATALSPALILLLVVRTALEDACLARELSGYEAYQQRVRYRLIPGLW
jgi:protein-S-isoprenylcysteine O-methyltransferase Ste14